MGWGRKNKWGYVQERKTRSVDLMSKPHVGHARFPRRFAQSSQNVWPQGTHAVLRLRTRHAGHSCARGGGLWFAIATCVEIKFQAPHAIDATSSP